MSLDTSFLGSEVSATSTEPAAQPSEISSAPTTIEAPAEVIEPVQPPVEGALAPPAEGIPTPDEGILPPAVEEELDAEAIEKLLADNPNSPKWFRDQLKKVAGYSGKLKVEKTELQTQIENLRSEYEGKATLGNDDLERMRAAEERLYKLSSFTAPPEDVLASIKEAVNPNKFAEIKNQLAWEFLETPTGEPDVENLQVIIDRFSGFKEGDTRVEAKDVLNAIQAIKRGTIKPDEFHEFGSDAEYEAFQRASAIERDSESQRSLLKANAEFQESQARTAVLQNVWGSIQGQFQPQVESLISKFQLAPVEGEPKVAADFKKVVRDRISQEINAASGTNASLSDVFKALELLNKPSGLKPDAIQNEINSYVKSFPYQTALSRGMSELMTVVERTVTEEAYRYKLMMMGYEQEVSKGQNARAVIGQPKQTEVQTKYTAEQLAAMSASERRHATLMEISNTLRSGEAPRYGG